VSKYSAAALVRFAMTLDTNEGYRIGKMGISLLQRFDAIDQLPSIFLSFYGYIAIYVEPLQVCINISFDLCFECVTSETTPHRSHSLLFFVTVLS
jgi:hypothetical protein